MNALSADVHWKGEEISTQMAYLVWSGKRKKLEEIMESKRVLKADNRELGITSVICKMCLTPVYREFFFKSSLWHKDPGFVEVTLYLFYYIKFLQLFTK